MPSLHTAYLLSKELNVSLEYLITGVEPFEKIPDDLQNVINKYASVNWMTFFLKIYFLCPIY